jgi:polyisoprenoid-binding protein YceI
MKTQLITSLLLLVPATTWAVDYQIDPAHSAAQFAVRHMMISNVKGEFTKVSGKVSFDPQNLAASSVEAVIDATSLSTREPQRDTHLKSPDFFDVAKFPTLTFKSKQIYRANGQLMMKGDLTMRGVTKEVVMTVDGPTAEIKDPYGNLRIGASATAHVNRKDWGLNWNGALEAGGVVVGDEVTITIDMEAMRKPEKSTSAAK